MIPNTPNITYTNYSKNNYLKTSKTYLINFETEKVQNIIDELDAIKQAVYMILNTEKEAYTIYPLNYGINLEKYIGKPYEYITGDIAREIKEALLNDKRIIDVNSFKYEKDKNIIKISFNVISIFGEFLEEITLNG